MKGKFFTDIHINWVDSELWKIQQRNRDSLNKYGKTYIKSAAAAAAAALSQGTQTYFLYEIQVLMKNAINPLKTSPEYTRAGVYGKCMLYSKIKSSSTG